MTRPKQRVRSRRAEPAARPAAVVFDSTVPVYMQTIRETQICPELISPPEEDEQAVEHATGSTRITGPARATRPARATAQALSTTVQAKSTAVQAKGTKSGGTRTVRQKARTAGVPAEEHETQAPHETRAPQESAGISEEPTTEDKEANHG